MKYDYSPILATLPFPVSLFEDDDFIHFQTTDLRNGSLLLEEKKDKIIIWDNDLKLETYTALYKTFKNKLSVPICMVFIDTEIEYQTALEIEAVPFDFQRDYYPSRYGSFIL